jgi:ribosomal protein L11 methyltransferase
LAWLEVTISLSGELAEPVSDLFSRYAPGGVVLENLPQEKFKSESKLIQVRAYLPEDDQLPERRRAIEEGLWHLSQIQELPPAQFHLIQEKDWGSTWKVHYVPIPIGSKIVIQPAWIPIKATDRIPILIDPGMAFGTGTHPTTQLCLAVIEDLLKAGQSVIDLGCGSGILSIAAAKLGAGKVLGLDIDAVAVQNARKNVNLNHVNPVVTLSRGSLELLLEEMPSPRIPADLVVANIITKTLEELVRAGLGKLIHPRGFLILSGILDHQVGTIQTVCEENALQLLSTHSMDDWRALVFIRKPPSS